MRNHLQKENSKFYWAISDSKANHVYWACGLWDQRLFELGGVGPISRSHRVVAAIKITCDASILILHISTSNIKIWIIPYILGM